MNHSCWSGNGGVSRERENPQKLYEMFLVVIFFARCVAEEELRKFYFVVGTIFRYTEHCFKVLKIKLGIEFTVR